VTRSSLPFAVALAASAGLLLAACGGGGSDSSDKIQPSATAAPTTTAPAPTTTPAQAAGPSAPTFDLPSDMKIEFSGFTSSDTTQKAVLQDATYAATAVVETEAQGNLKESANMKRFFTGEHGAALADQMIAYARTGKVASGSIRYYQPKVTVNKEADSVTVAFCEDQRKAYDKDVKTGKVNVTSPSLKSFNAWTYVMAKASSGEWQVFNYNWVHGAEQCHIG
jgi:hypothetical protein